jgi:2-dehydro-3-deoxyglucarate aldolase/4-hydroxy-2-oxoheptanedioate aldolase
LVNDGAAAQAKLAAGWTFVAIGSDSTLLAAAATAQLGRARAAATSP